MRIRQMLLAASLVSLGVTSAMAQEALDTPPVVENAAPVKLTPEQKAARKAERQAKVKAMTPEERKQFHAEQKAKWQARYDAASPEKQKRMMARKEARKAARNANHQAPQPPVR